jgi:hypothetical protein
LAGLFQNKSSRYEREAKILANFMIEEIKSGEDNIFLVNF